VSDQKKKTAASSKPSAQSQKNLEALGGQGVIMARETEVGRRYAKAVFELALSEKALDAVSADLGTVAAWSHESPEFLALLTSPVISPASKTSALMALADKAGFHDITRKFLGLLTRSGRLPLFASLHTSFIGLMDGHNQTVRAHVVTSVPMSAAQAKSLSAALSQALGAEPSITSEVDPSLLGGIKVKVGSRLFDASLKTQLDSLKFALKRA